MPVVAEQQSGTTLLSEHGLEDWKRSVRDNPSGGQEDDPVQVLAIPAGEELISQGEEAALVLCRQPAQLPSCEIGKPDREKSRPASRELTISGSLKRSVDAVDDFIRFLTLDGDDDRRAPGSVSRHCVWGGII
jgi:hypothetical protein